MATIKSFTSLEQSRKLAEILPLESADMYYEITAEEPEWQVYFGKSLSIAMNLFSYRNGHVIPCWSLSALLGVLPEIQGGKPVIALDDNYITYPHMSDLNTKSDNLVDACVAMIEKLNKLKFDVIMDEYDKGYYDALKWVYEHTYGDNYKLQVKDKMQEFVKK